MVVKLVFKVITKLQEIDLSDELENPNKNVAKMMLYITCLITTEVIGYET